MTIHILPVAAARRSDRNPATRSEPDRVELLLVAGLIVATAAQFALVAVFWLT